MSYFTTTEFRQLMPDMSDEPKYPDELVDLARDFVESLIERVCGTSFTLRTVTETLSPTPGNTLRLSTPYVASITSVTEDGVALSGYTYTFTAGLLQRFVTGTYIPTRWVYGNSNVTVVYTAGYSSVPPNDLKVAAMLATRDKVMSWRERSGKPSDRATSITNEYGNVNISTASPEYPTGLPEVDAIIIGWRDAVRVPTVA